MGASNVVPPTRSVGSCCHGCEGTTIGDRRTRPNAESDNVACSRCHLNAGFIHAVALLAKRRETQAQERAAAPKWTTITYEGEQVSLVFTNPTGGLVLRQAVTKVVKQAAKTAASPPTWRRMPGGARS